MTAKVIWVVDAGARNRRRHAVLPSQLGPSRLLRPSFCGIPSGRWYVPADETLPKCKRCLRVEKAAWRAR